MDLYPKRKKLLGNKLGRIILLIGKLRMGVQMPSERDYVIGISRRVLLDFFEKGHKTKVEKRKAI
jgi:hypothetical protein